MPDAIQSLYDGLWGQAQDAYADNAPQLDPHLNALADDHRRGLSLIMWVDCLPAIHRALDELTAITSGQFIYSPDMLHITFLSLIPVREPRTFAPAFIRAYDAALRPIFADALPITIRLQGATASPSVIMLQGFPDENLNPLRDAVRQTLQAQGLGDAIDSRFPLIAAHVTLLRFRQSEPRLADLAAWVTRHRHTDFGTLHIKSVDFTLNDYYMLPDKRQTLVRYAFAGASE